jgi:glycosyltransferase involved in cell wall biosynthesis
MLNFTVAIPTYNGAQRLPVLLDHLRSQQDLPDHFTWEVLVVDNNSRDNTQEVLHQYSQQSDLPFHLRWVQETRQGAAFARQCAVRAAHSDWLGFLDDDIQPDQHWIAEALKFIEQKPEVGVFGGQIHGSFESPPPPDFKRIQSFLAIRERGNITHPYDPDNLILPPSAAWVVNRAAWLDAVPPRPSLSGRVKGSMVQGDDYEPLLHLHQAGWEIWYVPTLHVHHHIPSWRLERDYLLALSRGCGLCVCQLRMINAHPWQRPWVFTKTTLGSLKRLTQHRLKYRNQIKYDLVAACEEALFLSSFLSSIYFLKYMISLKLLHLDLT